VLRDIRHLQIVQQHPEVFSEGAPVYFRADLVREVIAYEQLSPSQKTAISVYSDWDAFPENNPLDASTLANLKHFGVSYSEGDINDVTAENSFRVTANISPQFLDAFKYHLIDQSIHRFHFFRTNLTAKDFKSRVKELVFEQRRDLLHALYGKSLPLLNIWGVTQIAADGSGALETDAPSDHDPAHYKILNLPCEPQSGGYTGFHAEHLGDQVYGICLFDRLFIPVTKINMPASNMGDDD